MARNIRTLPQLCTSLGLDVKLHYCSSKYKKTHTTFGYSVRLLCPRHNALGMKSRLHCLHFLSDKFIH